MLSVLEAVHPRVRGAHGTAGAVGASAAGPSPRARGSRHLVKVTCDTNRSIPACAGLTSTRLRQASTPPVHPRVRGAHPVTLKVRAASAGPSPSARGSHVLFLGDVADRRSIPACAGLTNPPRLTRSSCTVHPRVRGAHGCGAPGHHRARGPSPRARGSPAGARHGRAVDRSIPACAGLTARTVSRVWSRSVHPRVRGAHMTLGTVQVKGDGPSPRARGSQPRPRHHRPPHRSIPACAGLTRDRLVPTIRSAVHPRVRGAHRVGRLDHPGCIGPSPRARGSPAPTGRCRRTARSIPACAGLTTPTPTAPPPTPVHPRVRGAHEGLGETSPSARRSIPACAGLTTHSARGDTCTTVHPRVRGAHAVRTPAWANSGGPSPRARGSLHLGFVGDVQPRSIPACAGLTRRCPPSTARSTVHPRVRGAHDRFVVRDRLRAGPSPRARGSLGAAQLGRFLQRSIPACAGLT